MARKFKKADRKRTLARIRDLYDNHTFEQIAETMASEGFKTPDGHPIKKQTVASMAYHVGMRTRRVKAKHVQPELTAQAITPTTVYDAAKSIPAILASNLPTAIKREIINLYI